MARTGHGAFRLDPVKFEIEFYHGRRRALARYSVEAARAGTPADGYCIGS